ncbi:MAG: hydrogenase formation protein HypD [Polyangiaceae bacterium]
MKYLDEFRNAAEVHRHVDAIRHFVTGPHNIMEVCGGQTHALVRFGIDELLPPEITLLHGPGCPVCVTPTEIIDRALAIAARPGTIFCSYGDMLRVPGSQRDLFSVKALGGDVRIVYSALDAVQLAAQDPTRQVVFFAVGFETTAPAHAMAVIDAERRGLDNFSLLVAHVLVPPALETILNDPDRRVHGFLAAGHVCAIMGTHEYDAIASRHHVPIVVTGFEPLDLVQGILRCVMQLENGQATVENQYARVVRAAGNGAARSVLSEVFETVDRRWRGLGTIPKSGLSLRDRFAGFDAERKFPMAVPIVDDPAECLSGEVLTGHRRPNECPSFGAVCTPDKPLGATMVSAEGACAAYFRYKRREASQPV